MWLVLKWCSAMLLLRSPIFVARLCSISRVVKVSAGLTDISGLRVEAFDLINCSWSVFRFVFALTISE